MTGEGQRSGERTERKAYLRGEGQRSKEEGEKDRYKRKRTEK